MRKKKIELTRRVLLLYIIQCCFWTRIIHLKSSKTHSKKNSLEKIIKSMIINQSIIHSFNIKLVYLYLRESISFFKWDISIFDIVYFLTSYSSRTCLIRDHTFLLIELICHLKECFTTISCLSLRECKVKDSQFTYFIIPIRLYSIINVFIIQHQTMLTLFYSCNWKYKNNDKGYIYRLNFINCK